MILAELYAVISLILVHAPDGREIEINPKEISSIRNRADSEGHFAPNVKCVLSMTNGKFIATMEDCKTIVEMVEKAE
jgi:hypothetical protein